MNRFIAFVVVLMMLGACGPREAEFVVQLRDSRLVVDHLDAGDREATSTLYCTIGARDPVGLTTLDRPPACEILADERAASSYHLMSDGLLESRRTDIAVETRDDCSVFCRSAIVYGRALENERTVYEDGQGHGFRPAGQWVIWLDRRHDTNGLCFFPSPDPDCATELYGYDVATGAERRLTTHGTVYPPFNIWGRANLSSDGRRVAYVDRRAAPDVCFGADRSPVGRTDCRTTIRILDLQSGADVEWTGTSTFAVAPVLAGDHIAWFDGPTVDELVLKIQPIDGSRPARTLPEADEDRRATYDDGWLVFGGGGAVWAYDVVGERLERLSDPRETATLPWTSEGRVVWVGDENTVVLHDIETADRRILLEVSR